MGLEVRSRSAVPGGFRRTEEVRDSATDDWRSAVEVGAEGWGLQSSAEELKISARLLLHISRQPRLDPEGEGILSLTQSGMAESLGTSQAAVSNSLKRLVRGGALSVQRRHVGQERQRLKVYELTDVGERIVRHIQASMEEAARSVARRVPR